MPFEPFGVMDLAVRAAFRLPQRAINTVVTNVPGPPAPLYVLGRRIREILPWVARPPTAAASAATAAHPSEGGGRRPPDR